MLDVAKARKAATLDLDLLDDAWMAEFLENSPLKTSQYWSTFNIEVENSIIDADVLDAFLMDWEVQEEEAKWQQKSSAAVVGSKHINRV